LFTQKSADDNGFQKAMIVVVKSKLVIDEEEAVR